MSMAVDEAKSMRILLVGCVRWEGLLLMLHCYAMFGGEPGWTS